MLEVLSFLCQCELLSWIFRIGKFIPQLRRITLKLCQLEFHMKNYLFYHLPTRGRAGIKLGDAWYVPNVSIIFDCSMLYYLLFWEILGFNIHFYIIFGTNLLTGGPAQICCFFAYFSVSKKRNIKRSRNGTKSTREVIFGRRHTWWTWTPRQKIRELPTRVGAPPLGRAPYLVGPSWLPWRTSCTHIYPRTIDQEFRRQKPP